MKVRELIAELEKLDQSAEVVIGTRIVTGLAEAGGRIRGDNFVRLQDPSKQRDKAITFTAWEELSTGDWVRSEF